MSKSDTKETLVQRLEDAKEILRKTKSRISSIRMQLDPVESRLRLQGISEASSLVDGTFEKLIILPSALEERDPIGEVVQNLEEELEDHPTFVKLKDQSESEETCRAIVRIVEEKVLRARKEGEQAPKILLILRWTYLPKSSREKPTVYLGNRYLKGSQKGKERFIQAMKKCGFTIYEDKGEYGGGPIAYHLSTRFSGQSEMTILQMTVPKDVAVNSTIMLRLLSCVSSYKV